MRPATKIPISAIFFHVVVFFLFAAQTTAKKYPITSAVKKHMLDLCKKRPPGDYKACMKKMSSASDLVSGVKVSLSELKQESLNAQRFMDSHAGSQHAVKTCAKDFIDTLIQMNIGEEALKAGEATYDVHTAYDTVGMCRNALSRAKVGNKAIKNKIQQWLRVYNAAYTVVALSEQIICSK